MKSDWYWNSSSSSSSSPDWINPDNTLNHVMGTRKSRSRCQSQHKINSSGGGDKINLKRPIEIESSREEEEEEELDFWLKPTSWRRDVNLLLFHRLHSLIYAVKCHPVPCLVSYGPLLCGMMCEGVVVVCPWPVIRQTSVISKWDATRT